MISSFFEALAIHAEALNKIVEAYPTTPQEVIIESTQSYLETDERGRSLYMLYMSALADHTLRAAGRAGYPTEVYNS